MARVFKFVDLTGCVLHTIDVLHHFVQTLPLRVGVVLGIRRSLATGWVGLPLFLFWLVLMGFIWLQLLGIARFLTMHFSPLEIGMTIVVGIGSVVGIVMFWRLKSTVSSTSAGVLFITIAAMQWLLLLCYKINTASLERQPDFAFPYTLCA